MQATDVAMILRPQSPYIYDHGRAAMLRPLRTSLFFFSSRYFQAV